MLGYALEACSRTVAVAVSKRRCTAWRSSLRTRRCSPGCEKAEAEAGGCQVVFVIIL